MSEAHSARTLVGFLAWAIAGSALAAHPLQTEDTGTQGQGNLELENGLTWTRGSGLKLAVYQPQLSLGVLAELDLVVQPAFVWSRRDGMPTEHGLGDGSLDAKWRFYDAAPLSWAIRAGATLATSKNGLGLPHGTRALHALLAATYDAAPLTVHGNVGYTRVPKSSGQRSGQAVGSAAILWATDERLSWAIDGGIAADPDPARGHWPATLLVGVIYSLLPGLDVDTGFRSNVGSTPATRQFLLGLTYRFSP